MKTIDNRSIRSAVMAAALSIGLGFGTHASANSYLIDLKTKTATDLGDVYASAINDVGQVVGDSYAAVGPRSHAFITGPNGVGMTSLGMLLGGNSNSADGINNTGQVVGSSDTFDDSGYIRGPQHAFITGPNGVSMTDLNTLYRKVGYGTFGINNTGQVTGGFAAGGFQHDYEHAFITGPNGVGVTDLGTLPGGYSSEAVGINDTGQVVGWSDTVDDSGYNRGPPHAFITGPNGVGMTDLGTLGGKESHAADINDAGQVVGWSNAVGEHYRHAFITDAGGLGMIDLGTLGGNTSFASGINDAGQVVGYSQTADGVQHAFITGSNEVGMTDLNSLVHLPDGLFVYSAVAINNMGQVLVTAATPVIPTIPEPESYVLMLAGLVLTGVMVRRKQKADAREAAVSL